MAGNEIKVNYLSGYTLYAMIRNDAGNVNIVAGATFEAYTAANIANYDIALTENGDGGGHYVGNFNVNLNAAGRYLIQIFLQAGGVIADSDICIANQDIVWNGSAEVYVISTDGRVDIGKWLGVAPLNLTSQFVQTDAKKINGLVPMTSADVNTQADLALSDAGVNDPPTRAELTTDKDSIITEVNANETKIDIVAAYFDTEIAEIIAAIAALNDIAAADVVTALMADTGITAGGVWTFEKAIKVMVAMLAGKVQLKSGQNSVYEFLDPDDGTTVIAEFTLSESSPYRAISVL